ncbi:MAG: hypothetical protein JXA81_15235 [Sedimentisphaerales bacterium]|nr:hypothetical protein [Sedimentisphaerales bacterium]
MERKYKPLNRPSHFCSRGPDRRKREHVENLRRWDVRDYIDKALPDVEEADYWDDDEEELDMSVFAGYAENDPRDPAHTIFKVQVETKPGCYENLQIYRGTRFPNTPHRQTSHFWYWICPECKRHCKYLYSITRSRIAKCRICWEVVYRSQSESKAQRNRRRKHQDQGSHISYWPGAFGSEIAIKGVDSMCVRPPVPPPDWVPEDLLARFEAENRLELTTTEQGDGL